MRNTKLFYGSSYDRGLENLLKMWPDIKEAVPEATLDICYGWDLFMKVFNDNPERMAWKAKIDELMAQDGITHHGRVSKDKLAKIRKTCGIWAYPTAFEEINCITALESQLDGLVPVVTNFAALQETVGAGVKVDGDIYMAQTRQAYKQALIDIMTDPQRWQAESLKAQEFAKSYSWDLIADSWVKVLEQN